MNVSVDDCVVAWQIRDGLKYTGRVKDIDGNKYGDRFLDIIVIRDYIGGFGRRQYRIMGDVVGATRIPENMKEAELSELREFVRENEDKLNIGKEIIE